MVGLDICAAIVTVGIWCIYEQLHSLGQKIDMLRSEIARGTTTLDQLYVRQVEVIDSIDGLNRSVLSR